MMEHTLLIHGSLTRSHTRYNRDQLGDMLLQTHVQCNKKYGVNNVLYFKVKFK